MKSIVLALVLTVIGSAAHGEQWSTAVPDRDPIVYSLDNLAKGWFEPAVKSHDHNLYWSHGFLTETAFTHRTMLTEASLGQDEQEVSLEFDIPVSGRLSTLLSIPYVWSDYSGFGDFEAGLRAIWIETDDYILSTIASAILPTGVAGVSDEETIVRLEMANWWYIDQGYNVQSNLGFMWETETGGDYLVGSLMCSKHFETGAVGYFGKSIDLFGELALVIPISSGDNEVEYGVGSNVSLTNELTLRIGIYLDSEDELLFRLGTIWEY